MELSIDTASETASVALSRDGELLAEITWRCHRNHSAELLPTIERLLGQAGAGKDSLAAVFVCTGPGMYTGLRVGITVAKGLARALEIPVVGIGRLELDAYPYAVYPGTIVAVHRAGRGELAWAAYRADPWRELLPPALSRPEALAEQAPFPALFAGEVDEELAAVVAQRGGTVASASASIRRAGTLAQLGSQRLREGAVQEAALLSPVYLRPPAIGPQTRPDS
jgi:tRNA threonylcarbamoyl adenosine modification protein YeaZ